MTSAVPKHLVPNQRTALAALGVVGVLTVWAAAMHEVRSSASMQVELPEYARNLSAGFFLIAGGARLVCWRIARDWAAGRVALLLLGLGTALPAGSVLSYALDDGTVGRIEAPEARLLYVLPLVALALIVSTGNRRRFATAATLMIGVGLAVAVDMTLFHHADAGEHYAGFWILVESAAVGGWTGLAFHAWTRRHEAGSRGVYGWGVVAMVVLAISELVKVASLTGTQALEGMSAGLQLCAAAIIAANAVRLLVAQLRQRVLDDEIGRMLLLGRDRIDEIEQAQRERLHDARSAVLGVKGASSLLTATVDTNDAVMLRSLLMAELDRLQSLLETGEPEPCEPFDVRAALLSTITSHRLAGATIHESLPALTAFGRPLVTATAVDNLLRNAQRHAPGATVYVDARLVGDQVEIIVEDDGPGIAADQQTRVLLPGIRGATARGAGSGLGLSNAATTMADQNGALRLERRRHGGTRVIVTLPAGQPARTAELLLLDSVR